MPLDEEIKFEIKRIRIYEKNWIFFIYHFIIAFVILLIDNKSFF